MTVLADIPLHPGFSTSATEGKSLIAFIDRWIFAMTAGLFIVIVLTGFIPDSFSRIAAIEAGKRPPFSPYAHIHAVLMGSWMLLLLAQATLMATGRRANHFRLGMAAMVLAPAMVAAGFVLTAVSYHETWDFVRQTPKGLEGAAKAMAPASNILLLQSRIGLLFGICVAIALPARRTDPDLHKRLLFLGTATALPAAFNRIKWLPTTMPDTPWSLDLYIMAAILPLLLWDLYRRRSLPKAYVVWLALFVPVSIATHLLWGTPRWLELAPRIMGVA